MVPEGWTRLPLSEICKKQVSYGIVQTGEDIRNGVPCLRVVDLTKDVMKPDEMIRTSEAINESYKKTILEKDEIVMALRGEVGLARLIPPLLEGANITRGLARISAKREIIDPKFLLWAIRAPKFRSDLTRRIGGSALQEISLTELRKVLTLVPPLPEQKKIAQILSTWDKAITTTEQLLANSQQQKKALMQQLLTGKKRLLDQNGVRFSGEWERVKLKDVAECLDNKRIPLNSTTRASMSGEYPYWGANGVVDYINDYIFDETIVLLAEDGGNFSEYNSRPIANISYGKSWVNNHAHILKAKTNSTNEWVYYSLVNKNILGFVNGGTRAKLNKSDMLLIPIELPSLNEQKRINIVLSEANREIKILQNKLAALNQEKKALMQQLLTGKRRVKADEKAA